MLKPKNLDKYYIIKILVIINELLAIYDVLFFSYNIVLLFCIVFLFNS